MNKLINDGASRTLSSSSDWLAIYGTYPYVHYYMYISIISISFVLPAEASCMVRKLPKPELWPAKYWTRQERNHHMYLDACCLRAWNDIPRFLEDMTWDALQMSMRASTLRYTNMHPCVLWLPCCATLCQTWMTWLGWHPIEAENLVPALKPDGQMQFLRAQVRKNSWNAGLGWS